ncbi:hypothetical protein PHSY_002492 [Pseudozyma hubeiensis SY62]|uniref:Uncharacterized protein n=1 Tax=Pseudozyma hubeiensis (strain SY62) TaxID=1305764 RepID=R9P189_PSEHS|nr:hypothetical protein PHSY_002492 [Pseudozyma hubeiensis SY62]GAC94919.1 hypothetical protein PHSY_002492 [Pseudozyma hubeiensis SY62]
MLFFFTSRQLTDIAFTVLKSETQTHANYLYASRSSLDKAELSSSGEVGVGVVEWVLNMRVLPLLCLTSSAKRLGSSGLLALAIFCFGADSRMVSIEMQRHASVRSAILVTRPDSSPAHTFVFATMRVDKERRGEVGSGRGFFAWQDTGWHSTMVMEMKHSRKPQSSFGLRKP